MAHKPREEEDQGKPRPEDRHLQFPQESWTEIDAEGTDSEMAQGRQSQEPFYTPLVTEAAERKMKKDREQREKEKKDREQQESERVKGEDKREEEGQAA